MILEVGLQALEDLERVLDRRLVDVDLLEAPRQRPVLLEVLAILLVGRRPHAAQRPRLQRRLQQVRGVHRPAARRPRADDRMDLVDEQDGVRMVLELLHHRLQPLLEVAAIPRAREQRPHVEREDRGLGQHRRRLAVDDLARQPLGDGRLADAGIADQQGVVLPPPAEDLDTPLDLEITADQRIHVPPACLLIQVDAVLLQCGLLGFLAALSPLGLRFRRWLGTLHRPRFPVGRVFRDAMADVVDRVVTGHVLLLQEIGRMALALREDRDEDVRPRHLGAARALDMDRRPLDHPLEARGRRRLGPFDVRDQRVELLVEEGDDGLAQLVEVDPAGLHDPGGVRLVDEREEKMFERRKLVLALVRLPESVVDCGFEGTRKRGHSPRPSGRTRRPVRAGVGQGPSQLPITR